LKKYLILFLCLFLLTGCKNKPTEDLKNEKISSEIDYLSFRIENLLNSLNNISLTNYELATESVINSSEESSSSQNQSSSSSSSSSQGGSSQGNEQSSSSENNKDKEIEIMEMKNKSILKTNSEEINWDTIKEEIENINTSWPIILLDLQNANISEDSINEFSKFLNDSILSIKEENKKRTLENLTNMYSCIPKFLETSSKYNQNLEKTKLHVFLAYFAASEENWNEVETNLLEADKFFQKILEDEEFLRRRIQKK